MRIHPDPDADPSRSGCGSIRFRMLIHNTTFLGELLTEKNLFDLSFFEIFTSNDSNLFIGGRGECKVVRRRGYCCVEI
jgi:hypothetical protein